jgi:DNA integrity scanning protein DisA with diadenylate cyclase activity
MNGYPAANTHFSCKLNQKLLLHITRLRDALVEMQKSMQEKHLACCIFPRFHAAPEISRALDLVSLFYPGNPLHDDAVIVKGTSVVAAGCVLPLTADHMPFKLKDMGMRHRAGVGLSQVSDAVVFIVSEETGTISMATEGPSV